MIYVADSESNTKRNPGWKRGIRVGSAKDGKVTAFIPDPEPDRTSPRPAAPKASPPTRRATSTARKSGRRR